MATKTILLGIEVGERIWVSGRDAATYAIRNAQKYCHRTTLTRIRRFIDHREIARARFKIR